MTLDEIKRIAKERDKPCSTAKLDDIQISEEGLLFLEMCFDNIDKLIAVVEAAREFVSECDPSIDAYGDFGNFYCALKELEGENEMP